MTRRPQTDIFVIICVDFQEALSLLVYRDLWYMDAQVCFLKVLFKSWINHFFQNSTEISSDGRLKTLITFRLTTFRLVSTLLAESLRSFHLSRKIARDFVRRVLDQILGSYHLSSCMAFSVLIRSRSRDLSVASWFVYVSPEAYTKATD